MPTESIYTMKEKNSFATFYKCEYQECGDEFYLTARSLQIDIAKGLSFPSMCAKCRNEKIKAANKMGLSSWPIPVANDFGERSLEEVGLGKLDTKINSPQPRKYDPDEKIAENFKILEAPVNGLIQNLIDPQGSRVSILIAPTGTGKSVWATSQILRSQIGKEGKILVTQPRKVTLRVPEGKTVTETTPGFIATKILGAPGVGAGHEVGFRYRDERYQYDQSTRLLFLTDGILINWLISGDIESYRVIIIDEAHEQSLNIELIFALLRYKLPLFPHLRVVIMSATIDAKKFQAYFKCFGKGKPKKVPVFRPESNNNRTLKKIYYRWGSSKNTNNDKLSFPALKSTFQIPEVVSEVVETICTKEGFTKLNKPNGDILVFVPTVELVNSTKEKIENITEFNNRIEVLPCHAQMNKEEQENFLESEKRAEQAFNEGKDTSPQRVIVATNYAETSATFPNLSFVIDTGYISEPRWDAQKCLREFPIPRHSQAGCDQRKGRVGRKQDGEVFRLYTKYQFDNDFRSAPLPEVACSNLDMFLLKAAAAGIGNLNTFHWLGFDDDETGKKQKLEKERAIKTLKRSGAIDEDGYITQLGFQLKNIELDTVELALFLWTSDRFGCSIEVATFLAFVLNKNSTSLLEDNERGLFGFWSWGFGCYDDLEYYLRLFYHWQENENAKDEWWQKYGFDKDIYYQIRKKRDELLEQISTYWRQQKDIYYQNTNKEDEMSEEISTQKRKLDFDRLHRVRLLLAWCMSEWAYDRVPNQVNLFRPLNPENCLCADPVSISESSACIMMSEISTFICIQRTNKIKNDTNNIILAHHVIRIDPSWVSLMFPVKVGIVRLSIMMKQAIEDKDLKLSQETRDRIINKSDLTPCFSQYKKLERRYRAVKRNGKTKHFFLVYDLESQELLIIKFKEKQSKLIRSGTEFRGYIEEEEIDTENKILTLSQWRFYNKGIKIENTKEIVHTYKDRVIIILEPGVKGILQTETLGESQHWRTQAYNGELPLQVKEIDNYDRSIQLEPIPKEFVKGNNYDGYVVGYFSGEKEAEEAGIFVEIAPNKKGRIPIPNSDIPSVYPEGDKVNVIYQGQDDELLILELEPPLNKLSENTSSDGGLQLALQLWKGYQKNFSFPTRFLVLIIFTIIVLTTLYLMLNRNSILPKKYNNQEIPKSIENSL